MHSTLRQHSEERKTELVNSPIQLPLLWTMSRYTNTATYILKQRKVRNI